MTNDDWMRSLEEQLQHLREGDRAAVLTDVREIAAQSDDGLLVEILGAPSAYAQNAAAEFITEKDPNDPQVKLGIAPVEFRGVTSSAVRSRIWNPANPRVFTSKLFGLGWDVNFGAIAVKLGLIRPDDYDEATVRAIPESVNSVSNLIPAALGMIVTGTNLGYLLADRSDQPLRRLLNITLGGGAAIWARRAAPKSEDALVRTAIASGAGVIAIADTLAANKGRKTGSWVAVAAMVAVFLQFVVPVRAGLNALWREEGEHRG